MSTQKNQAKETSLATINENIAEATLRGEGVDLTEAFKILAETDDSKLEAINAEYLKIETNKVYHFLFMGLDTATLDGVEREVVKLKDETGSEFISAASVLVSTCKKLRHMPCLIRVITRNKIKAAKGEYIDMSVLAFPGATS